MRITFATETAFSCFHGMAEGMAEGMAADDGNEPLAQSLYRLVDATACNQEEYQFPYSTDIPAGLEQIAREVVDNLDGADDDYEVGSIVLGSELDGW